ncbi:MAG: hypothetical protein EP343_27080 [Deltaproteobacteria bacterium]|nr:MAG: hypothetical protein EP343_27080 [Deltaproteobacteria bacterium]
MPNPNDLKEGDRIRILSNPMEGVDTSKPEHEYLQETYQVLEWMIGREFVVDIVDEDHPWVLVEGYPDPNHENPEHSITIMEEDTWEMAETSLATCQLP